MLWKLRAIVYGGGAAVIALILIGLGRDEEKPFLEGRTAQGRFVTVEKDGRPAHVGTWFEGTCEDDEPYVLRIREKRQRDYGDGWVGDRNHTLEARIDDGRVTGTMRAVEIRRHTSGTTYACESPPVTFSAG